MRAHRFLVVLPVVALIGAPFIANRTTPRVLGLPFLLAWTVGAVLLTAGTMALIHRLDRTGGVPRRDDGEDA
jgi:hypothetical protein